MKKVLGIILAVLMLGVGLFTSMGCGSNVSADLDGDIMVVATSPDFSPFEYKKEDTNELTGFDIELIKEIGRRMGVTVQFQEMDFNGCITAVKNGSVDVGISGFTITLDRGMEVLFSDPYIYNRQVVVVRDGDNNFNAIDTIEDLEEAVTDKKIGACLGYVGAAIAEWYTEDITTYANITLAITALKNESIDCFIMDYAVALTAAKSIEGVKVLDNISLVDEEYGIIVNLDRTTLVARINEQLRALNREGTFIENLKAKYINDVIE